MPSDASRNQTDCGLSAHTPHHHKHWFVFCLFPQSTGVTSALNCPENQFPYSCSTCLQIEVRTNSFEASREHCERDGGRLVSVGNDLQFQTLGRYLSGLNETRRLWIGYRFNGSGEQVGVTLDGVVVGDETSCIGVQEGMFVTAPCSTRLGFICSYTYESESFGAVSQCSGNSSYL